MVRKHDKKYSDEREVQRLGTVTEKVHCGFPDEEAEGQRG